MSLDEIRTKAKELYEQGHSLADIAAELNLSAGTVRSWKSRYKWDGNAATQRNVAKERCNAKEAKHTFEISQEVIEPLNDNQRLFAEYYADNRNATQAYMRAYGANWVTANTNGSRLLANACVRAYVDELLRLKREAIMLKPDDIVERQMKIAFANITDFVEFGRAVVPIISAYGPVTATNPETGEKEQLYREINEVRLKEHWEVDGGLIAEVKQSKDGASVKLLDRQKALDWLANYFEINPDDRHRRDYDNKKLELQERVVSLQESKASTGDGDEGDIMKLIKGLTHNE